MGSSGFRSKVKMCIVFTVKATSSFEPILQELQKLYLTSFASTARFFIFSVIIEMSLDWSHIEN
jgi:hypothetical protein